MRKIYIVACGANKLTKPAPAAQIYTGPLFCAALTYARTKAFDDKDIRILSAKHGLLHLDEVIEPYNVRLGNLNAINVYKLKKQLFERLPNAARVELVMLCPGDYTTLLLDAWRESKKEHADFSAPLRGLGIGQQIQWLKQQTALEQRMRRTNIFPL